MTVYVVVYENRDSDDVHGVFSTRELAQAYITRSKDGGDVKCNFLIREFAIDDRATWGKRTVFSAHYNFIQKFFAMCETYEEIYDMASDDPIRCVGNEWIQVISFTSLEHAMAVALEIAQELSYGN